MRPPNEIRRRQLGLLLRRARDGDRRAFDEIIERLTPLVWNVARAQGLSRETASDVVQTTWLQLLEHLHSIRMPEALAGWLVTVTRHEAHKVRKAQRRDELVEPEVLSDRPDPTGDIESRIADQEQYLCLWRNLRKLEPRCQELLRIVAFADRPDYRAIAEALKMPRGSIGPSRGRCLSKLRALLDADPTWTMR
jgi:RNA polymerase sigma factor (sigma-70 family)